MPFPLYPIEISLNAMLSFRVKFEQLRNFYFHSKDACNLSPMLLNKPFDEFLVALSALLKGVSVGWA